MDHQVERQVGSSYPKMPPKIEAMTMPRTTQQMMIMIFFCTREAGRKGLSMGEAGGGRALGGRATGRED